MADQLAMALASVVVGVMCFSVATVLLLYKRGKHEATSFSAGFHRYLDAPLGNVRKAPKAETSKDPIAFAPLTPQSNSELNAIPKLNRRVGRYSVWAGIGFSGLTVVLLLLSASTQYLVYEVDSVVTFVAAIVLLMRDPRAKVQGKVLDAVLISSNKTMQELSGLEAKAYTYVPRGGGVSDVVVVPDRESSPSPIGQGIELVPPGRALAEIFAREAGMAHPTLNEVKASLTYVLRESLGLAESATMEEEGDKVEVTIQGSSISCGCKGKPEAPISGSIGCTVASFLAVLVCSSTERPVLLGECLRDNATGTWKVPMALMKSTSGTR